MGKRIVGVVTSERDSMDEAMRRYSSSLLGFAQKRLRNAGDAEDAVQDVFVQAIRYRRSFGTARNQKAWLFQVMRGVIADHYRRKQVLPSEVEIHARQLPERREDLHRDMEGCVDFLAGQIPTAQGAAVLAVDRRKISQIDVARNNGLPHSTIKSRVQRGRARLKQVLLGCCFRENKITGRVIADDACRSQMGCCSQNQAGNCSNGPRAPVPRSA